MKRAIVCSLLLAGALAASEVRNPPAPVSMADEAMGGEKGPFYPSSVHTATGGLLQSRVFLGSETCGQAGCHPDALSQWKSSAHASSGLSNPWYRKAYEHTLEGAGAVPAKWCAGCHSPALLLSGGDQTDKVDKTVADAGVTCTTCHMVSKVRSTMGQGDYEISVPSGIDRLTSPDPKVRALAVKSIRKNPAEHRKELGTLGKPVLATAAFCSTCHKSHLDKPINGVGWVREDNDYDNWQASSISGQGARSFYQPAAVRDCIDCHMPKEGKLLSHRFAAANSALPALRGDSEQLRAVEKALKGSMRVDVFAITEAITEAETDAAAVMAPLDRVSAAVRRGESRRIDVVVRNLGVGHLFPGGKADAYDCWLELKAVDDHGKVVFWSGKADEGSPVDPGAHFYRSFLVDEKGERIDKRNTWAARAVVYQRRIQPNVAQAVHYRLEVPADAGSSLTLTARLLYRKFAWEYTRWAGVSKPMPILAIAEDSVRLNVLPAGAALPQPADTSNKLDPAKDWERFNDYGIALFFKRDLKGAERAFRKVAELVPTAPDGWVNLGLVYLTEGDLAAARPQLEKALALDPGLARTHFFLGQLEQNAGDNDKALVHLRKVAERFPNDRGVLAEIAGIQTLQKDFKGAVETLERILAGDPEERAAHYSLMLAQRALGNKEKSEYHQKIYQRLAPLDSGEILGGKYWAAHPHENNERQGVHEHRSIPLPVSNP
jgi:tetratricopeptide (TPR) repeat protein